MASKKRAKKDNRQRWYYDACVLDRRKSEYKEMFSKNNPIQPILSHLALGEAFANSYLKGDEQLKALFALIISIRSYIEIVQNDGSDSILQDVRENFPALPITDAMHIAIALENSCICIKTTDRDFYGQNRIKLNELGKKYNLSNFFVIKG